MNDELMVPQVAALAGAIGTAKRHEHRFPINRKGTYKISPYEWANSPPDNQRNMYIRCIKCGAAVVVRPNGSVRGEALETDCKNK